MPLSTIQTDIYYPGKGSGYSLKKLVEHSAHRSYDHNSYRFKEIVSRLFAVNLPKTDLIRILEWFEHTKAKPRSRTTITYEGGVKISFNKVKNNYLVAHYNPADLSMFEDFDDFKEDLSIVGKSFVTLGKPLCIGGENVYVRDTHLLTPAAGKSLASLGKLYENEIGYTKKVISKDHLEHMDEFLIYNKEEFESYAIIDALIPLIHATTLENVNFELKRVGIPITLSGLGRTLVLDKWNERYAKYFPYQINGDCLMGNADEIQTPKGLFASGDVGLYLSHYIGNYKGGRNESFMYGSEKNIEWFDYDLVGAYTTGMTHLSLPAYGSGTRLDSEFVKSMTPDQLMTGYLILKGTFKFPSNTKYPSIPCYMDKTTTVYPLDGECILTGPEYLLARNQKCDIKIKSAFYIPATVKEKVVGRMTIKIPVKPFDEIIKELQEKRREYPKGHILNSLYKEMANSIYGNVVRGMSNKKTFDTKTGRMYRVSATELSNPILASWTTAFIRSVIGECLHNIVKLGGKVVSVTTDGFITNLKDLESLLLKLPREEIPLLLHYIQLREVLSDNVSNHVALEVKNTSVGIIS